jgi:hypothetical protein
MGEADDPLRRVAPVHAPGYWATAEYYNRVAHFLQETDPAKYGHWQRAQPKRASMPPRSAPQPKPTAEQLAALNLAANAVQAAAIAMAVASPGGLLAADDDPPTYATTHPKNMWALESRMRAEYREVELPMIGMVLRVAQRHWSHESAAFASQAFELHTTGGICWDGSVVLADFVTHEPLVIASHVPILSRALRPMPSLGLSHGVRVSGWSWEGRTVCEIGCGSCPAPSFAAALCGAAIVLALDGSTFCVELARANALRFSEAHSKCRGGGPIAPVQVSELLWGRGDEPAVLRAHGFASGTADVVLCADGLYVLGNKGAWSALLRALRALAGTHGFILLTYTERGAGRQFSLFLEQAAAIGFHSCEVGAHLLHACSRQGSVGRLEQHVGNTRLFCLSPAVPAGR